MVIARLLVAAKSSATHTKGIIVGAGNQEGERETCSFDPLSSCGGHLNELMRQIKLARPGRSKIRLAGWLHL